MENHFSGHAFGRESQTPAGPSAILVYVLWWFFGTAGIHRFYMRRPRTGISMLTILVVTISAMIFRLPFADILVAILAIWWIVDAFLIYTWLKQDRDRLEAVRAKQLRKHREETSHLER